jgi:glycolate oxidase
LVPGGGGTGMWGGVIPTKGGIVLDMRKLDRVMDLDEEKCTVTVQAGVLVRDLANHLKKRGFFVADKPESWFAATVGARTQGSGTGFRYNARYGRSMEQVLCLKVVLPGGEVIRTGLPNVYDPASGYDLTRLFSNAEGTLGIITEVSFRIHRLPEHRVVTMFEFPAYEDAIRAVMAVRDSGLVPETLETMDGMSYCIYSKEARTKDTSMNIGAMVIGYAGSEKLIRCQVELTQEICNRYKGTPMSDQCVERWEAFKETYPVNPFPMHSAAKKKPVKYVFDATVPLASTAELVRFYHSLVEKYGIESREFSARHCAPDFQSVVYVRAHVDERNEKSIEAVRKMETELYGCVRKLGGGIGGTGGIGLMRLPYADNGDASALDLMKKLKQLLDVNNIMNPGKKFKF